MKKIAIIGMLAMASVSLAAVAEQPPRQHEGGNPAMQQERTQMKQDMQQMKEDREKLHEDRQRVQQDREKMREERHEKMKERREHRDQQHPKDSAAPR